MASMSPIYEQGRADDNNDDGLEKKMRSMFCTVVRMALIAIYVVQDPSMHVNESSSSNFFFPSSDMPMLILDDGPESYRCKEYSKARSNDHLGDGMPFRPHPAPYDNG